MSVVFSVSLTNVLYCFNTLFISGRKIHVLAVVYILADLFCCAISKKCIGERGIYGITDSLNLTQLLQCGTLAIMSLQFFKKRMMIFM